MKIKVKQSELKEYYNVIRIGYCNGYYLLSDIEPVYYTCGVYGWLQDTYYINYNTIISTGYAPVRSNYNNYDDYKIICKYEKKAKKIYNDYDIKWNIKKKKISKLREKFIDEIMQSKQV